ncbi:MAG: TIGR02453 family protein [Flavobacteriales bacterium]|mgnify:CR=1 FL=1|nr:TIGR02453 family protein [Flavobacteriales bacterium]|tara:strand:- start:1602 stop:2285 length:684 start_codon:yes stop_codon:yes gene_type:complete
MATITNTTFDFLKKLKKNNNRDWFTENKKLYQASHEEMIALADSIFQKISAFDQLEEISAKKALFRIYRDVRFSKNKEPYKTNRSGYYTRKGAERRGSYYFSIEPGNTFIGGGFYQPEPSDLNHIRQQIDLDASPLRKVLANKKFKEYYGEMLGEQLKTAPRDFDKDHPDIDLLRYKGFYFMHGFTDKEVLADDFEDKAAEGFKLILPFMEVMTEYLTTDLNGAPIV